MTYRTRAWTEYDRLTRVALHRPGPEVLVDDPSEALFCDAIDLETIRREHDALSEAFRRLNIRVEPIETGGRDTPPNLMFARDLFAITPAGAVLAEMFHAVRRAEVPFAEAMLRKHGKTTQRLPPGASFEGADLLWLTPTAILIGVGHRTNDASAHAIRAWLADFRVSVESIQIPVRVAPQHLLGYVQIVDRARALVRVEALPSAAEVLERHGFEILAVPESVEVTERGALNLVVIAPRRVLMAQGCDETKATLRRFGIDVVGEIPCEQAARAGGGLACLTGILARSQPDGTR